MAEAKPIPVRLGEDLIERLDKAAEKMGTTRAGVVRLCIKSFLDHLERHGVASLPLDWQEILAEFDGRTAQSRMGSYVLNDKPAALPKPSSKKESVAARLLKKAAANVKHPGPK